MKGAVMKVGQILSFVDVDGLVPASSRELFQSTLARLQSDVPPLAPDEIADVIRAELGARPEEIFAFFSPRPVAAASMGQVHMARLADGTELAVKVQYPGVSDAVRADLANTNLLASVIRAGLALLGPEAPNVDPKMLVEEIRDRVVDELDYTIEAANQQEFHALYDGHPFIHIPAVHPEFSYRPGPHHRLRPRNALVGGDRGRETPSARVGARPSSVSCSPACTDTGSSTPTRIRGTTSSTRTAPSPFSTSGASKGSPRSASRSCRLWWTPLSHATRRPCCGRSSM